MAEGTTTKQKKRASRGRQGSAHTTTLARRRTYTVTGQTYSRIMYMNGNAPNTIPGGTIPIGLENAFDRKMPTQIGLDDYPVVPAGLALLDGKKELETANTGEDGSFKFETELSTGKKYRLQAMLESGERIFPERVTLSFTVDKVPLGLATAKVKVKAVHEVQMNFKTWKVLDKERFAAVIEGSTLWLTGQAALVFDTFALEVEYMHQHLSPNLKRDLSNLRYHEFTYDGKTYSVPLHHLCLATCTTIMLRYYEAKVAGKEPRIEEVAEAAARFVLDYHTGKTRKPDWAYKKTIDENKLAASPRRIVEFTGGEYPHNNMDCVLRGAEALMKKHEPTRKFHWGGGNDDITKTYHPSLTCFLGLGWPFVIADDLAGTWDHGRVCVGAVVNHLGKVQHCYVLDPSRIEKLMVNADGSESDLGWCLISTVLPQSEISPKRFTAGGVVPAPRRTPFE